LVALRYYEVGKVSAEALKLQVEQGHAAGYVIRQRRGFSA